MDQDPKKPKSTVPDLKPMEKVELTNKLETSKHWSELTELQKKICFTHWTQPNLTKTEIAKEVSCSVPAVYHFFALPIYSYLSLELDKLEMKELRQLALKAARECLQSDRDQVKAQVALTLLKSEGLIKDAPEENREEQYLVKWGITTATGG